MRKFVFIAILSGFFFNTLSHAEENVSEEPSSISKSSTVKRTRGFFRTIGYLLNDQDTNYIAPNQYKFTLMLENSIWHENYELSNKDQAMAFTPTVSYKLGPYVGWSFIFLGWTFNVGGLFSNSGDEKRTEFSLNLYSSLIGGDLYFRKNNNAFRLNNLKGFGDETDVSFDQKVNGFSVDIRGVNLYYVFNHRKFSYPAAYSQSTNQLRSAGSFIAGFSFSKHKLELDYEKLPGMIRDSLAGRPLNFNEIRYSDYSISFGYAYNWVFARNFLANISFSPALAFKHSNLENEDSKQSLTKKLNLDFVARTAVTWNNGKYYVGASWVYNSYDYRTSRFDLQNGFGIARFYTGFNFSKKKKYK